MHWENSIYMQLQPPRPPRARPRAIRPRRARAWAGDAGAPRRAGRAGASASASASEKAASRRSSSAASETAAGARAERAAREAHERAAPRECERPVRRRCRHEARVVPCRCSNLRARFGAKCARVRHRVRAHPVLYVERVERTSAGSLKSESAYPRHIYGDVQRLQLAVDIDGHSADR
jgi:hypothetical protein